MALTTDNKELQALADRYMEGGDERYWVSMYVEDGFYIDTYARHPGMEESWVIIFVTPEHAEVSDLSRSSRDEDWMLGDRFALDHDSMIEYLNTLPKPVFQYGVTRVDPFTDQ